MSSSAVDPPVAGLVCELDNVQGMVDALTSVRWKRHQDAVVELSEHGVVLIVEETGCLQAKVYLQKELFLKYEYAAEERPRFGISLGLLVDCLNTFSVPGHSHVIELRYPGPDMELLIKSVDTLDACICAEIRTRIPDTIPWDYNFEPAGSSPLSFTVKVYIKLVDNDGLHHIVYDAQTKVLSISSDKSPPVCSILGQDGYIVKLTVCIQIVASIVKALSCFPALKEAIDDLEWPGASIEITLEPSPPSVTFKGEGGHGGLQVDFTYYVNTDLLVAFNCNQRVSNRYKYKFLQAATSNIPSIVIKDNRGSKLTIGRGGMLKVQHLVSIARPSASHPRIQSAGYQPPSRIAFIEFFLKPEEPCED